MHLLTGKTCVVLGGGGFLGAQLCPRLVEIGARVRAFGRSRHYDAPLAGTFWTYGRLEDRQTLATVLAGADIVFHLAGSTTPATAEQNPRADVIATIAGAVTLLELCRVAEIHKIIFASSGGTVYGQAESPPFAEDRPPRPVSAYGVGKLAVENYLHAYNHLHGMKNISLRISNPFGPYQHGGRQQGAVSIFARRALRGEMVEIWGDGSVVRDYVYSGDVADAFVAAATYEGQIDLFNIGAGEGHSLNELLSAIEAWVERPIRRKYLSARRIDVPISILDTRLAGAELNWRAKTPWKIGLRQTMAWISENVAAG